MGIKTQETFNFYSHLAGVLLSVAGMIFLFRVASTSVPASHYRFDIRTFHCFSFFGQFTVSRI